tara:strand:+ start:31294 stop:32580 length:1287 start_codon:yes stop_codon:yes gene_type:complete
MPSNETTKYHKLLPWIIWALGALLFFSEYAARVAPSVMTEQLQHVFHASAVELGVLGAFFYYAYVTMQIPVGMLVDRFGSHKLLTITALICALGSIMFAMADNLVVACIARFLIGFGASFAFVGTLKLASVWFPASRFGLMAGLTQAMGMFGAAAGEAPVAAAVHHYGWRETIVFLAVIFIILAILIGFIVQNHPPGYVVTKPRSKTKSNVWNAILIVISNPRTWVNAFYIGLLYAPTAAFAELWGPRFLHEVYGLDKIHAGFAVSLIYIGWIFGGPISGFISDKIGRRKPVMLFSAFAGMVLLGIVLYVPGIPLGLLEVLLFLYGLTNFGVAISYAYASEINPRRIAGTSMAFANMSSVIVGSWLFMPLIGWMLDRVAGHEDAINHIYTAHDFRSAMFLLPLCLLASFIIGCFLKETHCRNHEPHPA